jgi:PHP family Zn ribbon phosphoesterase
MPLYTIDLHNHSPHATGDYKGPDDTDGRTIVDAAVGAGVDVLAVSDHFSVGYATCVAEAAAARTAETGRPLLVLPGAELKLTWLGDEVHLIVLFPPASAERLFKGLLVVLGLTEADLAPERLHHIKVEYDPAEVARIVAALGGMSHVAHADRWFGDYRLLGRPILERLVSSAPIAAVEFLDIAAADELLGLSVACIQSSDSHHPEEIGRRSTRLAMEEPTFEALRRALALMACGQAGDALLS